MSATEDMSNKLKLVEINEKTEEKRLSESNEELCVVCFKNLEIYSIGDCDHPVCFECSTRMRVLCGQNECPICRQSLSKVIFTNEKRTYKDLEMNSRSEYYNKKYKIAFANVAIQKEFYTLLAHPCKECNCQPFHSFNALKDHVRREHELFYCDICTENLRIFSFERKCYTRQELAMHRRKGDPSSAHRGHPLCEYCDCRYLDRDELFRHLRREHFFCHFCDADGCNQFYGDYDSLREHFRNEHYLCEEGDCAAEQFTGVFRTDIDLRAHIANIHGKCFNKQQAKQARTLQLEITLGPRGRKEHPASNSRARNDNEQQSLENNYEQMLPQQHQPRLIDAKNEQEFPSLAGTGASSSNSNALVNHSNMLRRSTHSGLARTKENFPALNSANTFDSGGIETGAQHLKSNGVSASAVLKHNKNDSEKPKSNSKGMVIHVSNRPVVKTIQNHNDFPALPLKAHKKGKLTEDMGTLFNIDSLNKISTKHRDLLEDYVSVATPTTSKIQVIKEEQRDLNKIKKAHKKGKLTEDMGTLFNIDSLNKISTKHRDLLEDYVSVATPTTSKIQVIKEEQRDLNKIKQNSNVELKQSDFPALTSASTSSTSQPVWLKPKEAKKSKVALAPNLKVFEQKKTNEHLLQNKNPNHSESINKNNNKKGSNKNENSIKSNDKLNSKISKKSENNDQTKLITENKLINNDIDNAVSTKLNQIAPPPGFSNALPALHRVPPGFQRIELNSIAKPINDLTFESSSGAKYSVLPSHKYLPPPNSVERNRELLTHFIIALNYSEDAFKEFKLISLKFREGLYKPDAYYEHCQAALGSKFDDIFPELLALLPDISKQQELYLVHMQSNTKLNIRAQQYQKLDVCSICKQVVKNLDIDAHGEAHNLNLNFPTLGKK